MKFSCLLDKNIFFPLRLSFLETIRRVCSKNSQCLGKHIWNTLPDDQHEEIKDVPVIISREWCRRAG
jgi:hypothetical protein